MVQRVLVVDDSPTIRKVVAHVLARAGFEVGHAGDGLQALGLLKREKYDLALVDFVMPKLNGFELCRKIRDDDDLRELPVVLMSAKADRIREHFLRQTGALDAITKPFDPRALLLAIEGALQKVDEGRRRRSELPIASSEPPPSSTTDPFGPPSSASGTPDAFVRRLADVLVKVAPKLKTELDAAAAQHVLRDALGEDGLASLYEDVAGGSVLAGDLATIPLAEVLQLLQLQRQTGLLTVSNRKTEIQVALREGLVDLATSRGAADEFRLGRYLVESGKLERGKLDDLLRKERASGRSRLLGDALIADGILTRADVHSALARQTSELIYDVLRWTTGRFAFDHKATRNEASAAQLGLPVASIVMEGFRRVDEWRLMEGALGDFEQVFYRDPGAIEALGTASITREEKTVLEAVDGDRTTREIIAAVSMSSFDVCKILYQLLQSRLIRKRLEPSRAPSTVPR